MLKKMKIHDIFRYVHMKELVHEEIGYKRR